MLTHGEETKYWQEEYRKGNLDDVNMPGEIRCILDGTDARMTKTAVHYCLWALIPTAIMSFFAIIEIHKPILYIKLKEFLSSIGVSLGTGCDPTPFFVIEVIVVIVAFNILKKRLKKH